MCNIKILSPNSPQEEWRWVTMTVETLKRSNIAINRWSHSVQSHLHIRTQQVITQKWKWNCASAFFIFGAALLNGVKSQDEAHSLKNTKTKFNSSTEAAEQIAKLVQKLAQIGCNIHDIIEIKSKHYFSSKIDFVFCHCISYNHLYHVSLHFCSIQSSVYVCFLYYYRYCDNHRHWYV